METVDLIETLCSMHLGVNLRKAFLNGIAPSTSRKHHPVDTEFCEVFGKYGIPEYSASSLVRPLFYIPDSDDI
jgi:hypothetical protein